MRRVAVVRSRYPVVSEAFITEQMAAYRAWDHVVLCRNGIGTRSQRIVDVSSRQARLLGAWPYRSAKSHRAAASTCDLLHAHFGPDGIYACALASAVRRPFIVTFHGYDATLHRFALLRSMHPSKLHYLAMRQSMARQAGAIVAVSAFVRKKLLQIGFPDERLHVIHIGVDARRFEPSNQPKPDGGPVRLLSVGRLVESKALDVSIRAVAEIRKAGYSCVYRIVGEGPLKSDLMDLSNALGLSDVVTFTGAMAHSDVMHEMRRSDIFLFPSRACGSGAEEAFGIVLAEAAACGLPIVASDVGGVGEIVIDGKNGFLVRGDNYVEFANRLGSLVLDRRACEAMGRQGRQTVVRSFDIHQQTARLEALYELVVSGKA